MLTTCKSNKNVGRLEIITGCMFSGKSTELIRRTKLLEILEKKVLIINSSKDIRCCENMVKTHSLLQFLSFSSEDF